MHLLSKLISSGYWRRSTAREQGISSTKLKLPREDARSTLFRIDLCSWSDVCISISKLQSECNPSLAFLFPQKADLQDPATMSQIHADVLREAQQSASLLTTLPKGTQSWMSELYCMYRANFSLYQL